MKIFLTGLSVAFIFAISFALADAELPPGSIKTVSTALAHSVSIPLREMTTCPGGIGPVIPGPKSEPAGDFLSDPIVSFEGLHLHGLAGGNCSFQDFDASDDSGAVGFDYYVQVVNTAIVVYDKNGNVLAGPVSTTTFWANCPACCQGGVCGTDAVVRFDRYANRWVMSHPDGGLPYGRGLCMAISQTSDPTGAYDMYTFEIDSIANGLFGFFNDYAKIAVFPDAYYAVGDPHGIFSGIGNTISAFDRAAMLSGNPTPQCVTFFVPAPRSPLQVPHSHMLAADLDGRRLPPTGSPEYVVQVQDDNLGFPADRLQVYEFHVDWNSPFLSSLAATTSLVPEPFNSNACPQQSCIEQPGVAQTLDSLSYGYMMQRLTYRNFGAHQTLLFDHTVAADGDPSHNHAGIRWYELRQPIIRGRTRGPWEIYQEGTYAPDSDDRWLGSMSMDEAGNIAMGFSVSGAGTYPSLHYVGRRPGDLLGTLPSREVSLIDGGGVQLHQIFFGDYSQMTIDPADDCTFWYTGSYYPATGTPNDWHTRIGSFRFTGCSGRE